MRLIDADAIPWTDLNDNPNSNIKVLVTFADKVNRMPTIEERKKGKIIIRSNMLDGEECYCSECDHWGLMPDYEFCPYCGAQMKR